MSILTSQVQDDELRFRQLIDSLPMVAIQGYNSRREVIYWNDASVALYGYTKQDAMGNKLEDLIIPDFMRQGVIDLHTNWIISGESIPPGELHLKHKNGHLVPVFSSHVMLQEQSDDPQMFCVDIDLSEQHKTAEELRHLAKHDPLTQLPNRRYLEQDLGDIIDDFNSSDNAFALLFIDLDLFKDVNDSLGHQAGDELLRVVAKRLSTHIGEGDCLVRFGGDEFVLVVPDIQSKQSIETLAKTILDEFSTTFYVQEQNLYLTASLGISLYPENGKSIGELLKQADAAMYAAKNAGRNNFRFFESSMTEKLDKQTRVSTALRAAFDKNEFYLVFQPQVDLQNGKVNSCEALIRWSPEDKSLPCSPGDFIPVAERSDLIMLIGDWVLREVCCQLCEWRELGLEDLRIDINVSGNQLVQEGFFDEFRECVASHGLPFECIGIELTENVLISAEPTILEQLKKLRDDGVVISMDDFGTGYSSLHYLKHFPIHTLKIDRCFIDEAPKNKKDKAILEAMVQIGQKLELTVLVEGIETQQQQEFCQSLGCDFAQGYFFYRPMPAHEFFQLMDAS